ncbi:Protein AIG2 C [Cladobotryum mycophilum]|uniref:Putative gamma-glutamylcyclotransferase n=1 Tax=Cladobotryum mycophilum TaxID=491253 RepID=A0ABR0SMT6_9HYPO
MSGEFSAFFYGTLMAPEVFYSVCYGNKNPPKVICDLHTFTPAMLDNYCRHRVRYADYPGIIAEEGHRVRGMYVTGLTSANVGKLDYFEGSEYKRIVEKVRLLEKEEDKEVEGEIKETYVYVYIRENELEKREWDFEEFRQQRLRLWVRESPHEANANLS